MNREELLAGLAAQIVARRAVRIAIDGRCASGKTFLADELGAALGARRELNAYWDFRILVDIDAATALSRDIDVIGPVEVVRRKYEERYEPAWQIYVNEDRPEAKAEVIIDHREIDAPRILRPPPWNSL